MGEKTREYSIDILRIIACFFIVVRHSTDGYGLEFDHFSTTLFYRSLSYPFLAIFIMITGYFILKKEETYSNFFRKRLKKIFVPFIFWSLIYFEYGNINNLPNWDIVGFYYRFINGKIFYHLWYVYFIIGIYLAVPFLRKMVRNSTVKDIVYILLFWIVGTSVIPIVMPGLESKLYFIISGWSGYVFLGYFVSIIQKRRIYFITSIIILVSYFALIVCSIIEKRILLNYLEAFSFVMIGVCFSIMYLFKHLDLTRIINLRLKKFVVTASNLTFGIYLIHALLLSIFHKELGIDCRLTFVPVSIILTALIVFVCSLLIILIFSKIPILKKIV